MAQSIAVILHCWQHCVVSMLTSSCRTACLSTVITVAALCRSSSDVQSFAPYSARRMHRRGIVQIIVPKTSPWHFMKSKNFRRGTSSCRATEPLEKLGKRQVTRFLSDSYCKGIFRGQRECCNLRAYNNPASVVATGGRVCLDCSGKAWGWWRCSVCKVRQAACAFESWLAQHRSCNCDQVCSNCWKCPIPRGSISKAVQRVAATQAKVARRAAEEKKARAIADVWDAIAERKRNREQESSQMKDAEPKAKHPKQENGTEMTTEGAADVHGQREDSNGRQTAVRPMKAAEAMAKGKIFQYVCPHCNQSVGSTIGTGQVDHRRTCGNFFRVREGRPCAKQHDYVCPTCNGHVASNVATGQIDHRTVCGNQFSFQDRVVKEKGVVYRCPVCKRNVRSDVRTGQIDHRTVCGNNFSVQDGVVKEKGIVYRCPFCRESVRSDIRTGQINHRTVCGNQFYVKDGAVSCAKLPGVLMVVWSSQSCGRIALTHVTPSGKRCQMKHWHVPDKKAKKKRT